MSYFIAKFFLLLKPQVLPFEPHQFSVRRCRTFTACVVQHLLFSNSHIIATRHSIHDRVSVFAAFSAPLPPAGSVFSCSLIRRRFAASRLPIWARIARLSDRHFSACLLHLDYWRVLYQHSCWFKSFRYINPTVPVLVGWFENFFVDRRHVVLSSRFRISCTVVGSFFFFLVGFPVCSIAG